MSKDVAIFWCLISLLAVYAFGFFGWSYMPKDVPVLNNLYYICIASVIYGLSMMIFIIAKTRLLKIGGCLWLGVSSAALYNELFLDATNYSWWSFGLMAFISANLFLSVLIIEKIKNINGSNNNNK